MAQGNSGGRHKMPELPWRKAIQVLVVKRQIVKRSGCDSYVDLTGTTCKHSLLVSLFIHI